MKKFFIVALVSISFFSATLYTSCAFASSKGIVFVDVNKLIADSEPGAIAQKHLAEAKSILQGALDKVIAINVAKEEENKNKKMSDAERKQLSNTAQMDIQRAQNILQQQMQAQDSAVHNEMLRLIGKASTKWMKKNKGYTAVMPMSAAFAVGDDADKTSKVMPYLDELKPELPKLPEIQVTENAPAKK